ncbi:MAG: S24/S26 family peptidase [Clostridia bacterium]|nr:S24/S26 family peptidase [Clostridia bacterium]
MSDNLSLSDLAPVMEEVISGGGEFSFIPGGDSMLPFLRNGRDTVSVTAPPARLKKYDVPLYRRADGSFVLHRVIKVLPDGYTVRGDSQDLRERVSPSQIVALLSSFERGGKKRSVKNLWYRIYCVLWVNLGLLRRFILHFIRKDGKDREKK